MSSSALVQLSTGTPILGTDTDTGTGIHCSSEEAGASPQKRQRIEATATAAAKATTCTYIAASGSEANEVIRTNAIVTAGSMIRSTSNSTSSTTTSTTNTTNPTKRITLFTGGATLVTPKVPAIARQVPTHLPPTTKNVYRSSLQQHTNMSSKNRPLIIMDKSRSIAAQNQTYKVSTPNIVPLVPAPAISIEALKDLSKQRAAKSHAIAARIIAESDGDHHRKAKNNNNCSKQPQTTVPPPSLLPLLTMETLKDLSTKRARESKDIAARILREDQELAAAAAGPPHSNRYPCPAKKMGPAHKTAFFHVPPPSLCHHGMPLICSHALCRKGRLKFVYCRYCHQPVSRMKFDDRHAHPEQLLMAFADCGQGGTDGNDGDGNGDGNGNAGDGNAGGQQSSRVVSVVEKKGEGLTTLTEGRKDDDDDDGKSKDEEGL